MAGHAAVGVDDDLAAGQSGVAHRAADDEGAGRVEDVPGPGGVQVGQRHDRVDHVLGEVRPELVEAGALGVLAGDHDGLDRDRPVAVVTHGDLRLAVGPQVVQLPGLADLGRDARTGGVRARSGTGM